MVLIGYKNFRAIYASEQLIATYGIDVVRRNLGLARSYPVKTDLSGHTVMVEASNQEEAIEKYFKRAGRFPALL